MQQTDLSNVRQLQAIIKRITHSIGRLNDVVKNLNSELEVVKCNCILLIVILHCFQGVYKYQEDIDHVAKVWSGYHTKSNIMTQSY